MNQEQESNLTYCQSCGLPFDSAHKEFIAKEKDASDSMYCTFCYEDGRFINPNATVESMVETGVAHLGKKIGEEAAREQLSRFLPALARWRKKR